MSDQAKVRCGDCRYFVRDGRCGWTDSEEGRKKHPFGHAPFWVWSDCYSDREQVRANVMSACPTFEDEQPRAPLNRGDRSREAKKPLSTKEPGQ